MNHVDPYVELEYKECAESNRFISGVRFSFFGGFLTFFAILIGAYAYVWTSGETVFGILKPSLLILISLFGYLISFAGRLIETRTTRLNEMCVKRAITLERLMTAEAARQGYPNKEGIRIYELMDLPYAKTPIQRIKATHGVAIALTYRTVEIVWYVVGILSIYLLLSW